MCTSWKSARRYHSKIPGDSPGGGLYIPHTQNDGLSRVS